MYQAKLAVRAIVVTVLLSGVLGAVDGAPADAGPEALATTDLRPEQAAMLDWALALFDAADLVLPPLRVIAHDSTDPCHGRDGAHFYASGRSTIHLCTRETEPVQQFLYLHELAHAWDHHALSDARRRTFLDLRGLTEWNNDDADGWHDRGAEHAAEIIMWGLMDRPISVVRLEANSCAELRAGYVALVGRPPLHGYTKWCTR
jgi:hypothetical protein